MSVKDLSLRPKAARTVNGHGRAWWYEENGRALIVTDGAGQFAIHVSALRKFLRRLDTPPADELDARPEHDLPDDEWQSVVDWLNTPPAGRKGDK